MNSFSFSASVITRLCVWVAVLVCVGLSTIGCQIPVLVQCFDSSDCATGKSCREGRCEGFATEASLESFSCKLSKSFVYATPGEVVSMAFSDVLPVFATLDSEGWLAIWDKNTKRISHYKKLAHKPWEQRYGGQLSFHPTKPRLFVALRSFSGYMQAFDIIKAADSSASYKLQNVGWPYTSIYFYWISVFKQDHRFAMGIGGLPSGTSYATPHLRFLRLSLF